MSPRAYFQNFRLGKSNCFPATRGPGGVLPYNIDGVLVLPLGGKIWTLHWFIVIKFKLNRCCSCRGLRSNVRVLREKCRELFFQSQLIYNFIISSSLGRSERELEQRPKNVMRVPLRESRVGHFVRFDRFGHCGHRLSFLLWSLWSWWFWSLHYKRIFPCFNIFFFYPSSPSLAL